MTTSSTAAWPKQLRLPGQAAAPEGPIDMQMMFVMHHAFRRDLDAFAEAVRGTPLAQRRTWQDLAERWDLFAEVLHHHHTGEDEGIWPELVRRGSPEDLATLEAMEAEHGELDPLLQSCAAGFRRLARHADEDARSALAVRVCAARESLRRHLAHEETDAIAIIQRVLSPADWQRLDEEYFSKDVSPRYAARLVPWAAYGVPREVLDRVFADVGSGFWVVWLLTRRGFARREARTFRFVDEVDQGASPR
jgi:hemerythrin-like domain-containing protein